MAEFTALESVDDAFEESSRDDQFVGGEDDVESLIVRFTFQFREDELVVGQEVEMAGRWFDAQRPGAWFSEPGFGSSRGDGHRMRGDVVIGGI